MDELREEYGDSVDFEVVPPEVTNASQAELARYNLTARGHGLVAFTAGGEALMTLAGHNFGRDEVMLALGQITAR